MNIRSALVCILVFTSIACVANGNRITDFFNGLADRMQSRINRAIGSFDKGLNDLISDMGNFSKSLEEVADCYVDELAGTNMSNIFNPSLNFKNIAAGYYKAFPNKTVNQEGMKNLFNSVRDIISRCIDPSRRSSAKFGFTELSDKSDAEIQALFGVQVPDTEEPSRRKRLSGNAPQCQVNSGSSLSSRFDWRDTDKVTSVKNQGQCGSCWSFASVGALESATLIGNDQRASQNQIDLSEQRLVNCAKKFAGSSSGGCQGGTAEIAYNYIKNKGIPSESTDPYTAQEGTCKEGNVVERITDYCVRSRFYYNSQSSPENLSDDTIQRALVQNGPLYITINASPLQYRNLRGGVLDESGCSTQINHAVLLVGYTDADNAWIIKNSWGPYWGDSGYFKVVRGKNMCGINTEIAWPRFK